MLALETHQTGSLRHSARLPCRQIICTRRRAQHTRQTLELRRRGMTAAAAPLAQQQPAEIHNEEPRRVAIFVVGVYCYFVPLHDLLGSP